LETNHHLDHQTDFFLSRSLSSSKPCRPQPPPAPNSRWPALPLLLNLSFSSSLLLQLHPKVDEALLPPPRRLLVPPSTRSRESLSSSLPPLSSPMLTTSLSPSRSPPSYSLSSTHCQHQPPSLSLPLWETSFGFNHSTEDEDLSLPLYASRSSSSNEEPFTTAKWCFQWGFLLPLLWIGGVLV